MTLELPPLPASVRPLNDADSERLRARIPSHRLPPTPDHCITCHGRGSFRWYEDPDTSSEIVEYKCSCVDQWILHRFMLNAGIELTYQRLTWGDVMVGNESLHKVRAWLERMDEFIDIGFGQILYGDLGTGKTLIAKLMIKEVLKRGFDAYATTLADMISVFRYSWRDDEERRWFYRRIKNTQVLLLDDVGREETQQYMVREYADEEKKVVRPATAVAESILEEVVRYRVASSAPTLITTNLKPTEGLLHHYNSNIISLLKERSSSTHFSGRDYRDLQRARVEEEVLAGLTRPLVI